MKSLVILALLCVVVQAFPQRGPPNNFNFPGLDALLGGERPRVFPQSNTGGSDSDNESRGKLACMKACIGPTKCPSRQELKNETQEDRKECHDCIRASCGQLDPLDRRGVMKCVREAFENCTSCPPIPTRDRERVINCSSCLMQCRKHDRRGPGGSNGFRPTPAYGSIGRGNTGIGQNRGPGGFRPMRPGYNMMMGGGRRPVGSPLSAGKPPRRNKQSIVCRKTCSMLQYCPSMKEMKDKMQNVKKECKDCVVEECGDMTSNKTEDASCIAEARQECVECPPLDDAEQMSKKKCFTCLKQCSANDDDRDDDDDEEEQSPGDFDFGLQSIMGQEGPAGLLESIMPMLTQGMGPTGQAFGPSRQNGPVFGGMGPLSGGRGPMSGISSFLSRGNRPMSGLFGQLSGGRGPVSGIGQLFSGRNGPMSGSIRPFSGASGLLSVITQLLPRRNGLLSGGSGPFSGAPSGFGPFSGEHGPLSGGLGLLSGGVGFPTGGQMPGLLGALGQSIGGFGSIDIRRGPPGGIRPRPGRFPERKEFMHEMLKVITCARNEENCASCPTPKEARMRMINATFGCRKCVKEECGDTEAGNSTDKAECIRQARIDCLQCPPLTESEQMNKKKCAKCLMKCAPKGPKPGHFKPHRGSFGPSRGPFGPGREPRGPGGFGILSGTIDGATDDVTDSSSDVLDLIMG